MKKAKIIIPVLLVCLALIIVTFLIRKDIDNVAVMQQEDGKLVILSKEEAEIYKFAKKHFKGGYKDITISFEHDKEKFKVENKGGKLVFKKGGLALKERDQ